MDAKLTHNSYGKSRVRLTRVVRKGARHELLELSADILLEGDFADSYAGDNAKVVATDSMKNTVYVLGKEKSFNTIEEFAIILANHFTSTYPQVAAATVAIEQGNWQRIKVNDKPHDHAFVAGCSDRRHCRARHDRAGGKLELIGGISDLLVLKTTASEFWGFVTDRYRTLKDTRDRIFATSVDAEWVFADAAPGGKIDFGATFKASRNALLETFATHHSLAVQQTLLEMGKAVLAAAPALKRVTLTMPNKHRILFDLKPFGLENANEIFVTTDEPYGLITGVVERE